MRISDWSSDVCSSDLGGGFGVVVAVTELLHHRDIVTQSCRRGVVVVAGIAISGVASAAVVSLWRPLDAFGFLTQKLAIAQAQDALIDADRIGTIDEARLRQPRTLRDQRFSVDDDLALAAEIRRQGGLHNAFQRKIGRAHV